MDIRPLSQGEFPHSEDHLFDQESRELPPHAFMKDSIDFPNQKTKESSDPTAFEVAFFALLKAVKKMDSTS